jgi:hypothetical protein
MRGTAIKFVEDQFDLFHLFKIDKDLPVFFRGNHFKLMLPVSKEEHPQLHASGNSMFFYWL